MAWPGGGGGWVDRAGVTCHCIPRRRGGWSTAEPKRASVWSRVTASYPSCTHDVGRAALTPPVVSPALDFTFLLFCGLQPSFICLRHTDVPSLAKPASALPASQICVGQFYETRRHHLGAAAVEIPGVVFRHLRRQGQSPGTRLTGRLALEDPSFVCMA